MVHSVATIDWGKHFTTLQPSVTRCLGAGNANAKTPEESKMRGRVPRPSGRLGWCKVWQKTSKCRCDQKAKPNRHSTKYGMVETHGLRFLEIETGEEDLLCVGLWSGKTHYASGFEIIVQSPDCACITIRIIYHQILYIMFNILRRDDLFRVQSPSGDTYCSTVFVINVILCSTFQLYMWWFEVRETFTSDAYIHLFLLVIKSNHIHQVWGIRIERICTWNILILIPFPLTVAPGPGSGLGIWRLSPGWDDFSRLQREAYLAEYDSALLQVYWQFSRVSWLALSNWPNLKLSHGKLLELHWREIKMATHRLRWQVQVLCSSLLLWYAFMTNLASIFPGITTQIKLSSSSTGMTRCGTVFYHDLPDTEKSWLQGRTHPKRFSCDFTIARNLFSASIWSSNSNRRDKMVQNGTKKG